MTGRPNKRYRRLFAGGLSGIISTLPMSAVMLAGHALTTSEPQERLPPSVITWNLRHALGLEDETREHHLSITAINHFAFGGALGIIYSLVEPRIRRLPLRGPLFGLAAWAFNYFGLLPAAGLYPSPSQDSPRRNVVILAAHLVWGTTLQTLVDRHTNRADTILCRNSNARIRQKAATC